MKEVGSTAGENRLSLDLFGDKHGYFLDPVVFGMPDLFGKTGLATKNRSLAVSLLVTCGSRSDHAGDLGGDLAKAGFASDSDRIGIRWLGDGL